MGARRFSILIPPKHKFRSGSVYLVMASTSRERESRSPNSNIASIAIASSLSSEPCSATSTGGSQNALKQRSLPRECCQQYGQKAQRLPLHLCLMTTCTIERHAT